MPRHPFRHALPVLDRPGDADAGGRDVGGLCPRFLQKVGQHGRERAEALRRIALREPEIEPGTGAPARLEQAQVRFRPAHVSRKNDHRRGFY